MPRKTASPPTFDKTRSRWKATVPATLSTTGKRVRTWHPSREAAREWLASQCSTDTPSATIPPALAMKADEARLILDRHDLDILDAARLISSALNIVCSGQDVITACHAFKAALDAEKSSVPFLVAADAFLDSKSDIVRTETLRGYRQHLHNDLRSLHAIIIANLTGDAVMAAVEGRTPATQNAVLTTAVSLINWSGKSPRRWCDASAIVADIHKPSIRNEDDIHILDPEQARALLIAAESVGSGCTVGFAVAIFAGVRMRELSRLTWRNVGDDHLVVDAGQAKRGSRRAIPISEPLRAFLAKHRPKDPDPEDLIVGANWVNTEKKARRIAGWAVKTGQPLPKDISDPHRGAWPKNVCRHTCASILVATGTPLEALTFQFGHSGGHGLLRRHYVGRMTPGQAAAILALRPGGKKAAIKPELVEGAA